MHAHDTEAPRGIITELHEKLDAISADEPRNYLRQSLQLLVPLLEQMLQRLQTMEARLEALEFGGRRGPESGVSHRPSRPSGRPGGFPRPVSSGRASV